MRFFLIDGLKREVEILQAANLAEARRRGPFADESTVADQQLVLQQQLQKLPMIQTGRGGFVKSDVQGLREPRQPELLQCGA